MAWKSSTFKKSDAAGRTTRQGGNFTRRGQAQDAMSGVVLDAKKLADERRRTLNTIQDPELKRSAAR